MRRHQLSLAAALPGDRRAVDAGGVLIYETFAAGNETVGRAARIPTFCSRRGELLGVAAGLRVVAYEDGFLAGRRALRAADRRSARRAGSEPAAPSAWPHRRRRPATRVAKIDRLPTPTPMKPITGSIVALVTPMHEDGSVDYDALRA